MDMIERLIRAIDANEAADKLAMTCAGLADARRLDAMVCDADNFGRDFVRRHGNEILRTLHQQRDELGMLRQQLAAARLALVQFGAHDGACSVGDLDDEERHCACDCGYEAAIAAAEDKRHNALGNGLAATDAAKQGDDI